MKQKKNIQDIRDELMHDELLSRVTASDVAKGIGEMPIKKMMDQALYMKEELLPRVEKKQGVASADYLYFKSVYESLLWSIVLADRYESLERRYHTQKLYNVIARDHLELLEREVQKRNMLEEMELTTGLDAMRRAIRSRAEDLLKESKPK